MAQAGLITRVRPRILLVEDDAAVRRALQLMFHGAGYEVRAYGSPCGLAKDPEALQSDCLVADLIMPAQDAVELLAELRSVGWTGPAILISGFLDAEAERRATDAGFAASLAKPFSDQLLANTVARLLPQLSGRM